MLLSTGRKSGQSGTPENRKLKCIDDNTELSYMVSAPVLGILISGRYIQLTYRTSTVTAKCV